MTTNKPASRPASEPTPRERGRQTSDALVQTAVGLDLDKIGEVLNTPRDWRGPEQDIEYRQRLLNTIGLKRPDAGRDAGSEDPEVGALIETHERDKAASRFGPGFKSIQDLRAETARRFGSLAGFQPGRQLMTEADFKTPEEFEIYRAGADRLPLGVLPGSWEAHLLTAVAAMVCAGIERHETRMTPDVVVNADHPHPELLAFRRWAEAKVASNGHKAAMLSGERLRGEVDKVMREATDRLDHMPRSLPAADLAELRAFRQWCADKVNGGVIAATSEHLRGQVDAWIKERVDTALRKADEATVAERARIVKAIRARSKPSEKDYPCERHIAELIERGLL